MRRRTIALLLAGASLFTCIALFAQNAGTNPAVIVTARGPATAPSGTTRSSDFGKACLAAQSIPARQLNDIFSDYAPSIADVLGVGITTVTVEQYGSSWKTTDAVRKHLTQLLTGGMHADYSTEPWDEAVFTDIVAIMQFADKSTGVLENSGEHVCFTNGAGRVYWTQIKIGEQPSWIFRDAPSPNSHSGGR